MTRFYIQCDQIKYKRPALQINEMINTGGTVSNSSLTVLTLKYLEYPHDWGPNKTWHIYADVAFDFIECFTTTFLRAHSWLNWVDMLMSHTCIQVKYKSNMSGNKGWSCFTFRMAIKDDSESVQITKCSSDDLLTRESRSPATAKLSPGMGIGRDAD